VVLVIAPPGDDAAAEFDDAALDDRLRDALDRESLRDAASSVARETGLPRRRVYARALALTGKGR
jgi:16S rRNA (cytidine1402-2'-O)-methyltransferase